MTYQFDKVPRPVRACYRALLRAEQQRLAAKVPRTANDVELQLLYEQMLTLCLTGLPIMLADYELEAIQDLAKTPPCGFRHAALKELQALLAQAQPQAAYPPFSLYRHAIAS